MLSNGEEMIRKIPLKNKLPGKNGIDVIVVLVLCFASLVTSCRPKTQEVNDVIEHALAQSDFNGYLYVEHNNEVLFKGAIQSPSVALPLPKEDTPFYLASLTKIITKIAILRLCDQYGLELNRPISYYGVNTHQTFGSVVTVHDLIEMKSGLPRELNEQSTMSSIRYDETLRAGRFLDSMPDFKLSHTPGTHNQYSNLNYWILGSLIEKHTGQNLHTALNHLVFNQFGIVSAGLFVDQGPVVKGHMFNEGYWWQDSTDYSIRYASGGCYASMRDLIHLSEGLNYDSILSKTSKQLLKGSNDRIEVYGSLPGFSNVFIKDFKNNYTFILLNNTGLRDISTITKLNGAIESILDVQTTKRPRKVVRLNPITDLTDSISIEANFKVWIKAVETAGAEEIFSAIDRASVAGSMSPEDRTWEDLSNLNKSLPNFRALGYRWVKDEKPKGIEVWFGSDSEGKLAIRWLPNDMDSTLVENVFILPDDMTWQGKSY